MDSIWKSSSVPSSDPTQISDAELMKNSVMNKTLLQRMNDSLVKRGSAIQDILTPVPGETEEESDQKVLDRGFEVTGQSAGFINDLFGILMEKGAEELGINKVVDKYLGNPPIAPIIQKGLNLYQRTKQRFPEEVAKIESAANIAGLLVGSKVAKEGRPGLTVKPVDKPVITPETVSQNIADGLTQRGLKGNVISDPKSPIMDIDMMTGDKVTGKLTVAMADDGLNILGIDNMNMPGRHITDSAFSAINDVSKATGLPVSGSFTHKATKAAAKDNGFLDLAADVKPKSKLGLTIDLVGEEKPGFYSHLEDVINKSTETVFEAGTLKAMLKNKQVSDVEIQNTLGDLTGKVTKDELLGIVNENKTKFEDVVLGGPNNKGPKVNENDLHPDLQHSIDQHFDQLISDSELRTIMNDAGYDVDIASIPPYGDRGVTDIRLRSKPFEDVLKDEADRAYTWLDRLKADDSIMQDLKALEQDGSSSDLLDLAHEYGYDYSPEYLQAKQNQRFVPEPLFADYQTAGADPGTYREHFVTAPNTKSADGLSPTQHWDEPGIDGGWQDGHSQYDDLAKPGSEPIKPSWEQYKQYYDDRQTFTGDDPIHPETLRENFEFDYAHNDFSPDLLYMYEIPTGGDSPLIKNPVGRIRYNIRTIDGHKKLEVIEMQPPLGDTKYHINSPVDHPMFDRKSDAVQYTKDNNLSPDMVEQVVTGESGKMPKWLRDRSYDILTKKAIMLAQENGCDGIILTPGHQQAKFYNLENRISEVGVEKIKPIEGQKEPTYFLTAKNLDGRGGIINDPYSGLPLQIKASDLHRYVGQDLSKRIQTNVVKPGKLNYYRGLDLRTEQLGLKNLYGISKGHKVDAAGQPLLNDKGKPEIATIYSKLKQHGKFDPGEIGVGEESWAHFPITDKTPNRMKMYGGAPMPLIMSPGKPEDKEPGSEYSKIKRKDIGLPDIMDELMKRGVIQ